MAIVVKFKVSNMTAKKYETVLKRLEAGGAGAPPGRLHHVSYGSQDNLQVKVAPNIADGGAEA